MRKIVLFLLLFLTVCPTIRSADPRALRKIVKATTGWSVQRVASRGYYFLVANRLDSAELYSMAAMMRYHDGLPYKEKVNAAIGMNNVGYQYLFLNHSEEEAFRILNRARTIAEKHRLTPVLPAIYDNIAKVYDDFGDTANALHYYRLAFTQARRDKRHLIEIMAYTNLCAMALNREMLDSIRPVMNAIATETFADSVPMGRYALALNRGLLMMLNGDRRASAAIRAASAFIDSKVDQSRYRATHCLYEATALMAEKRLDNARLALRESERIALADSLSDMLPRIYELFARLETIAGKHDEAFRAYVRALALRDSLYSARSFGKIKELESSATIDDLNRSLFEAESKRNQRNIIIIILTVSVLVVLAMLWLLAKRNRCLRASYEALARKNSELADSVPITTHTVSSSSIPLSAEDQASLAKRIAALMESDPRIFSPDFSVTELASILDSKVKYISAVVNSSFGKSFSNLLADYRIREACRLLKDPEVCASMSFEGVAEKEGYRSRSHFSAVFKKVTGLTPTQYSTLTNA